MGNIRIAALNALAKFAREEINEAENMFENEKIGAVLCSLFPSVLVGTGKFLEDN